MLRINPILLLLIFASFPYGLPNHHFLVTFCFTCTSAGSRTHHFIHHQFAHLRTSLHFTYLIQKLANGAPTLHQFFMINLPSLGHAFFTLGHPFLYLYIFSQIIYYLLFIVQTPFPSVRTFFVVTVGDLLFWPYATHVTLGMEQYLSFTLADIVHIFRVPRRSVTSTL
jgi:hypothetical protein